MRSFLCMQRQVICAKYYNFAFCRDFDYNIDMNILMSVYKMYEWERNKI